MASLWRLSPNMFFDADLWLNSLVLQLDERAIDAVMNKLFKNYKTWCKFLGRKHSLRWDITISAPLLLWPLSMFEFFLVWTQTSSAWPRVFLRSYSYLFLSGSLKVLKKYNKERCYTWVYIFSYGVKQLIFASYQSVCAIFFIMWVPVTCLCGLLQLYQPIFFL